MGLLVKQNEERSELQQKIAADIEERAAARAGRDQPGPDGVDDARMVEGTAHLSVTGIIIIAVLVAIVIGVIIFASFR